LRAWLSALATLTCVTAPIQSALAQDIAEEDIVAAVEFAMHDATFTMYHEIGHMLVGELGIPVLGKEEDAADTLATILLLTDDEDEDSYNALVDSADGWYFNAVNSTGSGVDDFSYYDEHSLDIQRAYAMVCLMVGKDPEAFAETAESYELDEERVAGCADVYEQGHAAWTELLAPHEVVDEAGAEIAVIYEDGGEFSDFADMLAEHEVLERAARLVTDRYVLPGPVTFRATQCGEPNAYYSPGESEVTYCYELAAHMVGLYLFDILGYESEAEDETDAVPQRHK
jgi:hypothetical protein